VLQRAVDDIAGASSDIEWSVCIRDAAGRELARHNADRAMETASVGKLLLLIEVARQCADGDLAGSTRLGREPGLWVADSGLWQHLGVEQLSIHDLCVLVAGVSDNLAANVLLKEVGLDKVTSLADSLGLVHTGLLDYVRDHRGRDEPATLSTGSASELSRVMGLLARNELISPTVSGQVNAWLATGVDLSMVASAFGLDPLAHVAPDRDFLIRNKTGTEEGVRADTGTIERNNAGFSYAVIANWDAPDPGLRDAVLEGMRAIGTTLRFVLEGAS
jgi:beta-lactamase class A